MADARDRDEIPTEEERVRCLTLVSDWDVLRRIRCSTRNRVTPQTTAAQFMFSVLAEHAGFLLRPLLQAKRADSLTICTGPQHQIHVSCLDISARNGSCNGEDDDESDREVDHNDDQGRHALVYMVMEQESEPGKIMYDMKMRDVFDLDTKDPKSFVFRLIASDLQEFDASKPKFICRRNLVRHTRAEQTDSRHENEKDNEDDVTQQNHGNDKTNEKEEKRASLERKRGNVEDEGPNWRQRKRSKQVHDPVSSPKDSDDDNNNSNSNSNSNNTIPSSP